ncbi:hypothetical protein E1H18_2648 [Caulobacter sp. RHG1]|nr:hypothetical protein [Caulobacter sp. RHG1]
MLWPIRQLLVPCNYLRIKHGDSVLASKFVYDFILPGILTVLTVAGCWWLGIPMTFDKQPNLVNNITQLLALMIGFYLAALAAVATFDRAGIDSPLKGGDAILWVRDHNGGGRVKKTLSYRKFISYMFGYLSFLSLNLFILVLILSQAWAKLTKKLAFIPNWSKLEPTVVSPIIFAVVFFAIWQLVVTSMLAIYFLADRLQTLSESEN